MRTKLKIFAIGILITIASVALAVPAVWRDHLGSDNVYRLDLGGVAPTLTHVQQNNLQIGQRIIDTSTGTLYTMYATTPSFTTLTSAGVYTTPTAAIAAMSTDTLTVSNAVINAVSTTTVGLGAVNTNITGTAVEYGDGVNHKTVLTITSCVLEVADGGFIDSRMLYTFPAGHINIEGAIFDGTVIQANTNFNPTVADLYNMSVGTAESAAGDGTLTGTSVTVIPSTSIDTASGQTQTNDFQGGSTAHAFADGTSTAVKLYVNYGVPAANDNGDTTNSVTGIITFFWKNLGDY